MPYSLKYHAVCKNLVLKLYKTSVANSKSKGGPSQLWRATEAALHDISRKNCLSLEIVMEEDLHYQDFY
jgi:hypothetical protein